MIAAHYKTGVLARQRVGVKSFRALSRYGRGPDVAAILWAALKSKARFMRRTLDSPSVTTYFDILRKGEQSVKK
jgi:hypothetical protein